MPATSPNRSRKPSSTRREMPQKLSGDQYVLPLDEPNEDLRRPDRLDREDVQKLKPADPDPDDPATP